MKKSKFLVAALSSAFILGGCGAKDVTEYISVDFDGIDTKGTAQYTVNETKYLKEVFGFTGNDSYETLEEISAAEQAIDIKLDKTENLSNGDKVKVNVVVDEDKTDKIKGGEKEFEVTGLEEPKKLTDAELEKNTSFVAEGYSGQATGHLTYNPNDEDLPQVHFEEVDSKGDEAKTFKNSDTVQYKVTNIDDLADAGYILEGKGIVEKKVEGLKVVPEKVEEIKNLKEIKRVIKENNNREFEDEFNIFDENEVVKSYDVEEKQMYYRQFKPANNNDYSSINSAERGSFVGIYQVKEYDEDKKLVAENLYIRGLSNIVLDENENVNITQLEEISKDYDSSYSLQTVKSTLEGLGYSPI